MPNALTILFPLPVNNDPNRALPPTFVVVGLVPPVINAGASAHNVAGIQASLQHYVNGGLGSTVAQKQTRSFRPADDPAYLLWAIFLNDPVRAKTKVKLTVEAKDKGGATAAVVTTDLWLHAPTYACPTIDWPDMNNYTITGSERTYFVTYGSSDLPITAVMLGATRSTNPEWSPDDKTWWASFNPGAHPGTAANLNLSASNADGPSPPLVVNVAAM